MNGILYVYSEKNGKKNEKPPSYLYICIMKQLILILLTTLVTLSSCLGKVEQVTRDTDVVKVGQKLPQFTVVTADGMVVNNKTLQGKPSVIVFFNTMCSDCQRELPIVQRVYNLYVKKANFVCISRAQSNKDVALYWQKEGLSLPYSAQEDKTIYEMFATGTIPRIYVADASGTVSRYFVEHMTENDLTSVLDSLLN